MNYFVIGEREIVLAFGLVGVKGESVVTKDDALIAFNKATGQEKISIEMRNFIDDMTRVFATRVKLVGNESKGKIAIEYYSNDDLQRIYEVIESLKYNRL